MKIVLGLVAFFIYLLSFEVAEAFKGGGMAILIVVFIGPLVAVTFYLCATEYVEKYYSKGGSGTAGALSDLIISTKNMGSNVKSQVEESDSHLYQIAEQEVDSGSYDRGLWSQALVKCGGDESKRKITYMQLRVTQLRRRTSS